MEKRVVNIFTDGSCDLKYKVGGWAAILFPGEKQVALKGKVLNTTHNRMELTAVIKAIDYTLAEFPEFKQIWIFSDSQYVVGIAKRRKKLKDKEYLTKKGTPIQNLDLVKELKKHIDSLDINFVKVKAHQKKGNSQNYNREVDKLSRKIVRQCIRNKLDN